MGGELFVFIIDDDLDDQVLMRQAFEILQTGIKVQFATRSNEALDFLQQCPPGEQPDVIVSDYNMPMMNGEEFLRRLMAEERYRNTPKVILSTAASPAIIQTCMANGASGYLLKPSDFDELVKLAKDIVSLARS